MIELSSENVVGKCAADLPPLILLHIDLTEECPLLCVHCSNNSGPQKDRSFPIERLVAIIPEATALGAKTVVYSGGEPLRYPQLETAIRAARSSLLDALIFTTGIEDRRTRLPVARARWMELSEMGLTAARFSVYAGPSHRDFHNAVVHTKPVTGDAFSVNETAIEEAVAAGIRVDVHFIPSTFAAGDLEEIHAWATQLGCSMLHLQIPTYQGRNAHSMQLSLSVDAQEKLRLSAAALADRSQGTQLHVSRFWRQCWDSTDRCGCAANAEQLIIRSDGAIAPCNSCKYGSNNGTVDNVLTSNVTLASLWKNSPMLNEVRQNRRANRVTARCTGLVAMCGQRALEGRR